MPLQSLRKQRLLLTPEEKMKVKNLVSTLLALLISNVAIAAQPNWLVEKHLPYDVYEAVQTHYDIGRHEYDSGGISEIRYFDVENLKGKDPIRSILGKLIQQTRVEGENTFEFPNSSALIRCGTWDGKTSKETIAKKLRRKGLSKKNAEKKAAKVWREEVIAPCVKKMFVEVDDENEAFTYDRFHDLADSLHAEFTWIDDRAAEDALSTIMEFIYETMGKKTDVFTVRTDYIADMYEVFAISKDRKRVIFLTFDIGA